MMLTPSSKPFRLRSFVRRDSRITAAQERAYETEWSRYGLSINSAINYEQVFKRTAPRFLEIGFGAGQSLLALAKNQPDNDFIGVETHKPGIGALLLGIQLNEIPNLRVYHADVIDVLQTCIPDTSLDGIQLFFPDPWPKRKHHARRLIQAEFITLMVSKLKIGGVLSMATDWEDYAKHMMRVVSGHPRLKNLAGINQFAERSPYRPILTKFERRAEREGRKVWELQFSLS